MKVDMIQSRRLLQELANDEMDTTFSPEPLLNNTSIVFYKRPFKLISPFDSSMALTILILLTFLFFMGFFSVYIRRFSNQETASSTPTSLHAKKKGLDSSIISALPLISYRGGVEHGIIEDCTICLSEFEEGEMVKLIPNCRHVFHPYCIDMWLESHVSCPLCRCSHLFENADEEREMNGGDEVGDGSTANVDTSVEGWGQVRRPATFDEALV